MIIRFDKDTELSFSVIPPIYVPFYNEWGTNAYYKYTSFDLDPFTLRASSTSGSPVVLAGGSFFGFMNTVGGRFCYDGCGTLTVKAPAGQVLYYDPDCNPYAQWQNYNKEILKDYPANETEKFWSGLEYCTWVDQKKEAVLAGKTEIQACLNQAYVYEYMNRVNKMGLPKGKLTIDDGWDIRYDADGRMVYGNWEINREKFPDMEKLVQDMKKEGFIPGLWFAPFTVTPNSEIAKKYPYLMGETFSQNAEDEKVRRLMFLKPDPVLEEYYTEIFSKYIAMGFMKFKLDMSYGNKADMIQLLKMMYEIIKRIDKTVEVEAHIPDIFASRYCDTVRINDVNFDEEGNWRSVTQEHYKVCRYSSPDKILNLDHLGTNTPTPVEKDFLEHTDMLLRNESGYPCVSLLPDFFGEYATGLFVSKVRNWVENNK